MNSTAISTQCLIAICMALLPCSMFAQATPSSIADHLSQGDAQLAAGNPAGAANEFQSVLTLDPKNPQALAGLGTAQWMRGDCASARPNLRRALHAQPSQLNLEAMLGVCEKRLGDPAADTHLEAAFTQIKDARLRIIAGVELADLYYQRGDIDRCLPVVRELVFLSPDNIDILFFAQHLYQEMADETMNKLALVAPGSARMQQVIAERLVNAGDLTAAADHYRQALKIDPALPGAHFELAEAIVEAAPHDASAQTQSQSELEAALHLDGESARIECEIARVALLQGRTGVALSHYQRAYAMNPKEVEAQLGIGRILDSQDKPDQALRYFSEAATQDPLNAEAHYHYARALKALHRDDQAQQEMKAFETVRQAQDKVRQLYMQMNRRAPQSSTGLPQEEGAHP